MDKTSKILNEKISLIFRNIESKGFKRYDPIDIKKLDICNKSGLSGKLIRNFILVIEQYFPNFLRRIFKVEKVPFITAYTHIGEALLLKEKLGLHFEQKLTLKNICDELINNFYNKELEFWPYKENKTFFPIKTTRRPSMYMHGLSRANILLMKSSSFLKEDSYMEIALKSISYTLKNHFTKWVNNEFYISYMYNTQDCTINVNSEFAEWLSLVPKEFMNDEYIKMLNGITKMLIRVQSDDGSWNYFAEDLFPQGSGKGNIPDCHHNATIVYNLIQISKSNYLDSDIRQYINKSIDKGINYIIDTFHYEAEKKSYIYPNSTREAGAVQLNETIQALCVYKGSFTTKTSTSQKIENVLPKLISKIIFFVKKDGSTPSSKLFKWVNIDSIRWGNGCSLHAMFRYLMYRNKLNE